MQLGKFCLNWKVVGGLAAVALLVFVTEPQLIGRVLPYLLLAACPLSMIVMMGGMAKMGGPQGKQPSVPGPGAAGTRLSRQEQLAELRDQLTDADARKVALETSIRALESSGPEQSPPPRQAPTNEPAGPAHHAGVDAVS